MIRGDYKTRGLAWQNPRKKGVNRKLSIRLNKYAKYRQKCQSEGRCPHCGKPCSPYYECFKRRSIKGLRYHLNKLVDRGEVDKICNGKGKRVSYQAKPTPQDKEICTSALNAE